MLPLHGCLPQHVLVAPCPLLLHLQRSNRYAFGVPKPQVAQMPQGNSPDAGGWAARIADVAKRLAERVKAPPPAPSVHPRRKLTPEEKDQLRSEANALQREQENIISRRNAERSGLQIMTATEKAVEKLARGAAIHRVQESRTASGTDPGKNGALTSQQIARARLSCQQELKAHGHRVAWNNPPGLSVDLSPAELEAARQRRSRKVVSDGRAGVRSHTEGAQPRPTDGSGANYPQTAAARRHQALINVQAPPSRMVVTPPVRPTREGTGRPDRSGQPGRSTR